MAAPGKQYVVLHEFTTCVDDKSGKEKTFAVGEVYNGPDSRLDVLLSSTAFPDQGPLIAEKSTDAKPASSSEGN